MTESGAKPRSKAARLLRVARESGPTAAYRAFKGTPGVSLATFTARYRRLSEQGLTVVGVEEALVLSAGEFRAKYGVRRTMLEVEGELVDLAFYFSQASAAAVSYRLFWQRAKSLLERGMMSFAALSDALTVTGSAWITLYGGGRRQIFVYEGEVFPEFNGRPFHGIAALLTSVGRYNDRQIIWSRLKAGWKLDDALSIPVESSTRRQGSIYRLLRKSNGEAYIGLTVTSVPQRWKFHLRSAAAGATTPLALAIRTDGGAGFDVTVLEEGIPDLETLRQREAYWVLFHRQRGWRLLNSAKPGGLGARGGRKVEVEGVCYRSVEEASTVVSRMKGLELHVVRSRLRKGLPIPDKARKHSKHPEAGSNLFRRWLGLLKRHGNNVCKAWRDSYDAFKSDVAPVPPGLELVRRSDMRAWGPKNVEWVDVRTKVERVHGRGLSVHGTIFPSLARVAEHYGIGASTLRNRIEEQGMTVEEAVSTTLGPTSSKQNSGAVVIDGIAFKSKNQAIKYIAETRGLTEHQAKYRLSASKY